MNGCVSTGDTLPLPWFHCHAPTSAARFLPGRVGSSTAPPPRSDPSGFCGLCQTSPTVRRALTDHPGAQSRRLAGAWPARRPSDRRRHSPVRLSRWRLAACRPRSAARVQQRQSRARPSAKGIASQTCDVFPRAARRPRGGGGGRERLHPSSSTLAPPPAVSLPPGTFPRWCSPPPRCGGR